MLNILEDYVVSLPEDIQKAKDYGDYNRVERLIDKYLKFEKNESLRNRLLIEKEVIKRLPFEYPYTEQEALELIQKEIPDFTLEELRYWQDCGGADWIYRDGEVYLQDRFYASMKKVYPDIAKRAKQDVASTQLLDDFIKDIKENGEAKWHFHLRHEVKIKDQDYEDGEVLVHLPIPTPSLNMKNIEVVDYSERGEIDKDTSLSRTISFHEQMTQNHPFFVEYTYDSYMQYHDLFDGTKTYDTDQFQEYTKEQYPHITFTPTIQKLCKELTDGCDNPRDKAWNIYRYCTESIRYSFMRSYITIPHIPEYVSQQRIGDCGVMALLFITLCRCAGIPAKWQSGQYVTPDTVGNHDWAMFYIEPYGWLYCDPSFGNSAYHAGAIERQHFYFGNLDCFRMVANNALMQEFTPLKTKWRNDPFDNQSGEIEYCDHQGLLAHQYEKTRNVIEAQKIK